MSMINQMLKDLDSRQVRTGESQAMLTDVRLSSRQNRKLIKPLGFAVLAFSIGFGLFARFRQTQSVDPIIDNTAVASTVVADPVQPAPVVTESPTATKTVGASAIAKPRPFPGVGATNPSPAAGSPPAQVQSTADGTIEESPERALQRWFSAYSSGDSKAYLNAYAENFVPSNGVSRHVWEQQRRNFFTRRKNVTIEMTDVRIQASGAEAQSHFHQSFRSPGYNDDVNKTLFWRQREGRWLIVAEISQPQTLASPEAPTKDQKSSEAQRHDAPNKAAQGSTANRAANIKSVNPKQQSANFYRDAVAMVQDGHLADAQETLTQALGANPANHSARQMLANLLVDSGRAGDAILLLGNGLSLAPGNSEFCMALARLQVAAGAKLEAFATLQQGLANAGDDGDYHGFYGALLQSLGRYEESTKHYLVALRSNPSMPTWLVGIGISLRAQKKLGDAAEAFQRAIDTGELSVEVANFAGQQIDQIRRSR